VESGAVFRTGMVAGPAAPPFSGAAARDRRETWSKGLPSAAL
jgi:hypothetical protein